MAERGEDPNDKRGSVVAISVGGRRALKKAAPVYLNGIARHFAAHLDDAEIVTITSALQRIVAAHQPLIQLRSSR